MWTPSHNIQWLGIQVDLQRCCFSIPRDKIISTQNFIHFILTKLPYVSARLLAQLCGKILSKKFVLGDIAQLKTRYLYKLIDSRVTWDRKLNLKYENSVIKELLFWRDDLKSLNNKILIQYQIPTTIAYSDASNNAIEFMHA